MITIITDNNYVVPNMRRYTLQTSTVATVASGTTALIDCVFTGCPITSITIPNTVTSIGINKIIILIIIS